MTSDEIFKPEHHSTNTIHVGETPRSISFSGCGFLGVYHIGVASCLKTHAKTLLSNFDKIYGCSAGSMIGAMLLIDYNFGEVCQHTMDLVTQARSGILGPLSPKFKLNDILLTNLKEKLPMDAHIKATGKLHISLTRVRDGKNVIVSDYATREELIQVLLCSCFVPFYSGLVPPMYRGTYYIDGGLSNNLPADNETITVSPWSGSSDICPRNDEDISLIDLIVTNTSIQATPSNLYRCSTMFFPPHPKVLRDFCSQGFQETAQYLQDHGLFESTPALRKNPSFKVGLRQTKRRREMTRHLSMEGSLENFRKFRRNKTISESELPLFDSDQTDTTSANKKDLVELHSSQFIIGEEDDEACSDDEKNPDVLTVVHVYPIEKQNQLVRLHMILPRPILEALEQAFVAQKDSEKKLLNRVTSSLRNYVQIPIDTSYQLACTLLSQAQHFPAEVAWITDSLKEIITQIHSYFGCRGTKLVALLRKYQSQAHHSIQIFAERLSVTVLLLTRKLLEHGCPYFPGNFGLVLMKFFDAFEGFINAELLPMITAQ